MALEVIKSILLRVATDPDYRQRFLSEREAALGKYRGQLTEEELQSLMAMPYEEEAVAERVAEPVVPITFVGDIRS
jgi:hypothetical protein